MPKQEISEILNHLGEERSQYYNAVSPPIIQSSNFAFESIEALQDAIQDELASHIYTRGNNPTVNILRQKIAALENAEDALVVSSGCAAIAAAVMANLKAGDHVICVEKPYSWTTKLFTKLLSRFNIETTYIDGRDTQQIIAARKENTTLLYLESPNSLTFDLQDLRACADFAKAHNIVTVIDNSHCSPLFQNPIDYGIDLVVHSATKYLCGHSDVVMGAICGSSEMIKKIFDSEYMTLGMNVSPHDAWLAIRGLRTLQIRMKTVDHNAEVVFRYLKAHPKVRSILFPFDPDFPQYELAKSQMSGCGGLMSIVLNTDDKVKVKDFVDALDKFLFAVSWGGHESLKMPSLAFYDIPGWADPVVPYQMVRLYIGLEEPEYLIANLGAALDKI